MVEGEIVKYKVEIDISYSKEIEANSEDEAIAIAEQEIIEYAIYDCDVEPIGEEEHDE